MFPGRVTLSRSTRRLAQPRTATQCWSPPTPRTTCWGVLAAQILMASPSRLTARWWSVSAHHHHHQSPPSPAHKPPSPAHKPPSPGHKPTQAPSLYPQLVWHLTSTLSSIGYTGIPALADPGRPREGLSALYHNHQLVEVHPHIHDVVHHYRERQGRSNRWARERVVGALRGRGMWVQPAPQQVGVLPVPPKTRRVLVLFKPPRRER